MAILPQGELDDNGTVGGYHRGRYLIEGSNVEIVWIHRQGSGGAFQDPRIDLNPLIFRDRVLDGWGWSHFDSRSEHWDLPIPEGPPGGGT